jgi:septum formation protein
VLSSDTLVELDGKPLGKPENADEAYSMLSSLSGRAHNVHTGVAVHFGGRVYSGVDTTAVYFKSLTPQEISEYIFTGEERLRTSGVRWNTHNGNQPEWFDKAGAYAIQGMAGRFVSHYEGDFDTVVGLSMRLVKELIGEAINHE